MHDLAPLWWLPFFPGFATLLSALAAGVYVVHTVRNNREIARMRATLDMIDKAEASESYRRQTITFRKALASKDLNNRIPLDKLIAPATEDEIKHRIDVLSFLNHYELIAAGFESGVLDKGFYASYMRGALAHDWAVSKDFILRLREPGDHPTPKTIYDRFEKLALEWEWEIAYEERLRKQEFSKEQIQKAVTFFRKHPNRPRPRA
jgi:hypothetical protein